MERWHGCQSPDMSCLHLSRYFPSYHHIPAPMRQGRWDTRSQEAGKPIFSRTPWSSLPSLGGKVTQNLPRFLPIQNVVAFISIWTRIPNTLRRPQQFSTINWDTTTEAVTLYQVLETGEILTYPGDSWREAAKLDISSCCKVDSNCLHEAAEHVKLESTWWDLNAGHLR